MTEHRPFVPECAGFSLLEVLVAFSILAVSLGVLLSLFSTGLRNASVTRAYSQAVVIAESKLSEISATIALEPGEQTGIVSEHYYWQSVVTDYQSDSPVLSPASKLRAFQITVTVSWGESSHPRSVVLQTLRFADV